VVEANRPRPAGRTRRVAGATVLALTLSIPVTGLGQAASGYQTASPPYVALQPGITGSVVPLINSGETVAGTLFEGIPDGIGVAAGQGRSDGRGPDRDDDDDDRRGGRPRTVDFYVTHEQSHVPFGGFADFQDSSVSRVRIDVATRSITDLDVALPPSAGFIRFCSAFMVGPEHGFAHETFLVNEESNDILPVPAGAPYGADPSLAPNRQAGYSAYLDTRTGKYDVLAGAGRHNHENQVVVPGWKKTIVSLSGDDTFTSPSTPARPNLSQLYLYTARSASRFLSGDGTLLAFRVTRTNVGPVDPADPQNDANDFFEMVPGDNWKGEFIEVPSDIANGTTADRPQDALEDWSNANNVFQFIRVEDIAYDPDNPRVVYFADTGNSRLVEDPATGRLYRAATNPPGVLSSSGRIFKMVLNASDPKKVDSFSILAEASVVGMRSPDNIAVGRRSLMVQEDTSDAKVWMYSLGSGTWTHVASATQPTAETSGIVDVSRWFGDGWWALDVQSHVNKTETTGTPFVWDGPPGPPVGTTYQMRREDGQLLLMRIQGS
jgi:hypothetical protein